MSLGLLEPADEPYLSVVVTARNDDHGGDPLYRMQAFIDSLLRQCDKHRLATELIIVEWNPPEDRPRLGEVLSWPETAGQCAVRIIEVPHAVHSRLEHAEALPLFQMIAKNVGIRRARGTFVLATNIDLLFDDNLIKRLASRTLSSGQLYRVDRYDVPSPLDGPSVKWLDWCRRSVIRIHTASGSIDTRGGVFYPIGNHSRLSREILAAIVRRPRLFLSLRAAQAKLDELLDRSAARDAWAETAAGARQAGRDLTVLAANLVLTCYAAVQLIRDVGYYCGQGLVFVRDTIWLVRTTTYWFWCGIREPRLVPARAARRVRRIGAGMARRIRVRTEQRSRKQTPDERRSDVRNRERERLQGMLAAWHVRRSMPPLHTNACGDFTLMARPDWEQTRAYPELQRFSMHIDGLFLYQAHAAGVRERLLPYPVFHIEHASGFRPDTSSVLELEARLERDKIRQITQTEFLEWVVEMRATKGPLPFNGDDWGFRDEALVEYDPVRPAAMMAS